MSIVPGPNPREESVEYRGIAIRLQQGNNRWRSDFQLGTKRRKFYGPTRGAAQKAAETGIDQELGHEAETSSRRKAPSREKRSPAHGTRLFPRDRRSWLIFLGVVVLLGCLVVAFFVGVTPSFNMYDYPIAVVNAARALHGEKPYVDFEVYYGPLGPYIAAAGTAAMFFLPLVPAFNFFYVVCAACYLGFIVWKLMDFIPRRIGAYLVLLLYLVALTPIIARYAYYTLVPATMLIAAIQCSRKVFSDRLEISAKGPSIVILAGLAVVALMSRFNFGVYIFAATGFVGLVSLVVNRAANGKSIALLAGAMAGFMALAALILYGSGILSVFIHDLLIFLPRYSARRLPIPFDSVQVIILLVMLAILIVVFAELAWRRRFGAGLFAIAISFCVFQYALQRYDMEHAFPLLLLFPAVFLAFESDSGNEEGVAARAGPAPNPRSQRRLPLWAGRVFLGAMLMLAASFWDMTNQILDTTIAYWSYNLRTNHSFVDDTVLILNSESSMLQDLAANPATNTNIFWGSMPGCCESTTQSGANLNMYLAQRRLPVTKIWTFDPGSTAHEDIQKILISEIEAKGIKCISMQGMIDPSIGYLPGNPPEARLLYNYVVAHYVFLKRYTMPEGNRYYDIYIKKPAS